MSGTAVLGEVAGRATTRVPAEIGGWRIVARLGAREGLFVAVRGGVRAALKVLDPRRAADPAVAARFRRGAALGARVRHPNVARTIDRGDADVGGASVPWCATLLVEGEDLETVVRDRGPMTDAECRRVGADVACALAAVHAAGIVHCDVKGSNLVRAAGGRVHLIDFGLAVAPDEGPAPESFSGTLLTAAPEQLVPGGRRLDARADLYALGIVLFELASGRPPFDARDVASIVRAHRSEAPPALRDVAPGASAGLESVVARLLEKDPERRFACAADVAVALVGAGPRCRGVVHAGARRGSPRRPRS